MSDRTSCPPPRTRAGGVVFSRVVIPDPHDGSSSSPAQGRSTTRVTRVPSALQSANRRADFADRTLQVSNPRSVQRLPAP